RNDVECVAVIQKRIEPGSQQPEPVPQQTLPILGTRQPAAAPKKGPRSYRARQLAGSDHTRYQQSAAVRGCLPISPEPKNEGIRGWGLSAVRRNRAGSSEVAICSALFRLPQS